MGEGGEMQPTGADRAYRAPAEAAGRRGMRGKHTSSGLMRHVRSTFSCRRAASVMLFYCLCFIVQIFPAGKAQYAH